MDKLQGGRLFFMDIVSCPKDDKFRYAMQKLFAPFWYFASNGCKAGNIDAESVLKGTGFDVSGMQYEERPAGQWVVALHYFGVAVKPAST